MKFLKVLLYTITVGCFVSYLVTADRTILYPFTLSCAMASGILFGEEEMKSIFQEEKRYEK